MWKEILSAIQQIFVLTEKTEQNKEATVKLRKDVEILETKVEKLAIAVQL